jgi:hypothetical protein
MGLVQTLLLGISFAFFGVVMTIGKYRIREWILWVLTGLFLILGIAWTKIEPHVSGELLQSLNTIASNGWVWLAMIALSWIYLAFVIHPRPVIEIVSPESGAKINWSASISGLVLPRDSFVQVFAYCRDDHWHPLKAETTGAVWRVTGDIGSEDALAGTRYKLIAISGAKEITGPVLKRPRGEAKSRTIIVCRA